MDASVRQPLDALLVQTVETGLARPCRSPDTPMSYLLAKGSREDLILWLASGLAREPDAWPTLMNALRALPPNSKHRQQLALALVGPAARVGDLDQIRAVFAQLSPSEEAKVLSTVFARWSRHGRVDWIRAVLETWTNPATRARWLVRLAVLERNPDVRRQWMAAALDHLDAIPDPMERFRACYHMAKAALDPEQREALVQHARALIQQLVPDLLAKQDTPQAANLWRMLAEIEVDDEARHQAALRAWELARNITETWERAYQLVRVVSLLPPELRDQAAEEAFEQVQRVATPEAWEQRWVLTLNQVLVSYIAGAPSDLPPRAQLLFLLAESVEGPLKERVLRALAEALNERTSPLASKTVREVARLLAEMGVEAAVWLAVAYLQPGLRDQILYWLALRWAKEGRIQALLQALQRMSLEQARLVILAIRRMVGPEGRAQLRAWIERLPNPLTRAALLFALLPEVPPAWRAKAVLMQLRTLGPAQRALNRLNLAQDALDRHADAQLDDILALFPHLTSEEAASLAEALLDVVLSWPAGARRARRIARLIPWLPASARSRAVQAFLADVAHSADALLDLTAWLTVARHMGPDPGRWRVLLALVQRLPWEALRLRLWIRLTAWAPPAMRWSALRRGLDAWCKMCRNTEFMLFDVLPQPLFDEWSMDEEKVAREMAPWSTPPACLRLSDLQDWARALSTVPEPARVHALVQGLHCAAVPRQDVWPFLTQLLPRLRTVRKPEVRLALLQRVLQAEECPRPNTTSSAKP
ncbi:MAG: hypothetical protein GXO54_04255 [Chloroflexi bacterium]|nr:hypothetical protein [Chloroflexota bacterium]